MKLKKRIISFFLVLALCIGMAPVSAFAETLPDTPESTAATLETDGSVEIPTEETEEPDGTEESPAPAENPEQEQIPVAPEESPAAAPTEPPVSEEETAEEPQPEPAPTAAPEPEYVPGFTVEVCGGKYAWPVPSSAEVSQGYAMSQHEALDIAASEGSSILATEAGTVSVVQTWDGVSTEGNQSYGNMVQIAHADGNTTLYAHLSEITVTEGQTVERGEEIGLVGQTGNVTGPHLHFEVRSETARVCPTDYITGGTEEQLDPETEIPVYRVNEPSTRFRMAGERGKLRILYNCFTSNVGYLPTIGDIAQLPAKAVLVNDSYRAAYCLQIHLGANNGSDYTWSDLDFNEKFLVGDLMALGFQWNSGSYWTAPSADNYKWAVTQLMVWAVMEGSITRNSEGVAVVPASVDSDIAKAAAHSYDPSGMVAYYKDLKQKLVDLRKIPSFAARSVSQLGNISPITLKWDGSKYSASVTDKNGVLSNFNFEVDGVDISRNGNTLMLSCTEAITGARNSSITTYNAPGGEGATVIWRTNGGAGGTGEQDFVSYQNDTDPVSAYIKVKTDAVGSAGLRKISEDGDVTGKSFRITGSDGSSVIKTTDSSGNISLDGLPIYVASEDEESEEESSGERITYTAAEINVPIKYVVPSSQTFQLYEGQEASLEFENRLKKWRVTVTKTDRETGGTPQGDATLGGAVYGVYHNGILQDTYTTDSSGRFTTKYYVCGTGWTLKEITPSEGYLLNVETKTIGLSPYDTTIEYNSTSAGVKEQVIKGRVGITKHTDDGSTQIETPEAGAKFQVYLSSSGSYNGAKASERDIITIGENGYGETKLLPYGMYTVHQTEGWEGKEKIPDFQVFISEDGKTYSFIINNRVFEALIQIVKKDAETGKVIPASGIGFKIKDLTSGKWVSQHINYPTPMDLDTFYTDVTGRLMLPAPLTYGAYELYEQQSAFGYVISKDPIPFTVDGTAKTVVVEMGNAPQKGILTLHKTGEIFSSVKQQGGKYIPVYETTGLAGAVYAMYADEDIKTPDGTLRYAYGELIEKVETGEDGAAKFPAVYLGKYKVFEEKAPYGAVLDPTVYHVEFTYAGQEVSVITEALDCYDQRQKVEISLAKTLEKDDTFGIGGNGEYENIRFGLFAAETLRSASGREIPAGGLLEEIGLDETLHGVFTADLPLGSYYVQETQTDGHYVLSDKRYPVIFEYAGQKKATVRLEVDDGNPIENKLKRGSLRGHKSDEDGLFLSGAVFGLFKPDTEIFTEETALVTATTASNGEFSFEDIPMGHWLLREISVPEGFILDETSHEVNISEDGQVVEYDLTNFFIKGNVTLTKVDADYPGNKLSGAVFAIYADSNGNKKFDPGDVKIGVLEETAPGVYAMENLRYNGYFCVEEKAPEYFISDPTPRYFEIRTDGETVTLANRGGCIINHPQTGALKIVKTSEDGLIADRVFRVTGTALTGQSYDQTFITDENGEIFIDDLRIGSYTVSEVGTENTVQYVLPDSKTIEIGYDETTTAEFYNRLKRGSVQGHKSDEDGLFLSGVVFGLFSPDTETFTEEMALNVTTTAPNGDFSFERIPYGRYLLREIKAKTGFVLDETSHEVNITEDGQVVEYDLTNFFIKGNVTLTKVDADYPGNKLSGAVFAIYADSNVNKEFDPGDVKIGTLTEKSGMYGMENLRYNGYFCVEEKAPEFFISDPTPRYFEIRTDGETVTLANRGGCIINRPQTGALKIVKTSEDGLIADRVFRVTGTALTGQSYDQTFTTDEKGEIFIDDLRIGSYIVSEVGTENTVQYVLPADKVLAITYGETVTAQFTNRLKRGTIYGEKQDEDGTPLAGVVFGLFPADAADFSMENAFATAQTFEDGTFLFKDIPYGKWFVVELETLPGYVLLKEPVTVEITEDGQKVTLDPIQNEHTKVEISKQDMTTGKELPGAKLQLFDIEGKLIEEWISGTEPHLIERLPAGKYRLHEETAPAGFTVAEDVEFTVEETGEIQKVVMKDAPVPTTPNTGEDRAIVWVTGLFFLSLAGAWVVAILLRRQRRKEKNER